MYKRQKYKKLIGKRAVYKTGRNESRVVEIVQVTTSYVRVGYKYYGKNYGGIIHTCASFNSLLCGDDKLEV